MSNDLPSDLDPDVLAGLRSGDAGALENCYDLFGTRVYRICRAMLRHDQDAEDATQEVFLKVFERAHQFARRARFSTWLHRMTVNHCLNRIEKERRRRTDALDAHVMDASPSPVEAAQGAEARARVDGLLARVTAPQRAVLVLREVEGLAYAEIAEVLAIPVGTVMSRLARARERLAALVQSEHGEPGLPTSPRTAS